MKSFKVWVEHLRIKHLFVGLFAALVVLHFAFKINPNLLDAKKQRQIQVQNIRKQIREEISIPFSNNERIPQLKIRDDDGLKNVNVHYTFDLDIQAEAEKLLRQYKPDYGSIVAMEASTGKILALANFQKDHFKKADQSKIQSKDQPLNLALGVGYPAASIFKIIPAAVALDKYMLNPDMLIRFNGGNHTLYRKNAMSGDVNRWTRILSLKDAFARSINTVFARLTFEKMEPNDLRDYAQKFWFNKPIETDFYVDPSVAVIPDEKSYQLAEVASGFNKINKMSPIQGAMIAAAIADEGKMVLPYIVDSLTDVEGRTVYSAETTEISRPLTKEGAAKLKKLMEATIKEGTCRKSFRDIVRNRRLTPLEIGGKTGSLTGDQPRGKVDWFIGYAIYGDKKIAIAALTVNPDTWSVKSAYLARSIVKKYFSENLAAR